MNRTVPSPARCGAAAFVSVAALLLATLSVTVAAQPLPDRSPDRTLGVASCASSLCHGSIGEWAGSPVQQNEYVIWSRLDKHARAYRLLLDKKSRDMVARLGLAEAAHEAKVCLDCHAHNPAGPVADAHALSDGVGCEACHGPAERWIASHTEPAVTHAANLERGLYPASQPLARARLCLSCHFGNADKYVSHRLMAAGHPRLSFELETFTSLQPAHFAVDADYRERKGEFGSVAGWAVGQAVAVSTQMAILLDPVRGRDGVFPELTLFDCHACHRSMANARWAPRKQFGKSAGPGLVRLNEAGMLMLRTILRQTEPPLAERFVQAVGALHRAVAGDGPLAARAEAVKALADEAAGKLAASGVSDAQLRAMALALVDDGLAGAYADYVAAEQASMALGSVVAALHAGGRLRGAASLNRGLATLRAGLVDDEAYQAEDFRSRLRAFRPLLAPGTVTAPAPAKETKPLPGGETRP